MKSALVVACACCANVSLAAESVATARPTLRLAADRPVRGRFLDQEYLLTPGSEAWSPLFGEPRFGRLSSEHDDTSALAELVLRARPTGLIDELLHSQPVQQPPLLTTSRFETRDPAGWSGVAITSTVGE